MSRFIVVILIGLTLQACLYEKGYIRRIQIDPNGSPKTEEEQASQPNKVKFRKCMYSFIVLFWYHRPFPSTWNDLIADPDFDEHKSVKLKNAIVYIDGIDFFPPWTVFMLFLPFPTVPIMRSCGVVEGEVLGTGSHSR
ncbi:putative lipoprotein [Leptospira broomii serovar Hurstbridge str. 5399]|uniref:Lipoprotein n=1 Tax=Leptospira broomii serovar Hurstbridge str. 5399 TaxID=1049789 RepID=T0F282_9LEPT|nr:hypothetical protein [Leptospira broomii]EQA45225.1 putative lipoprotein [Leptospira broomii serovar Hurstbridge str. 5399]